MSKERDNKGKFVKGHSIMRSLKFRAWDTIKKRYVDAFELVSDSAFSRSVRIDFDTRSGMMELFTGGRYIIELDTGIKDKNGKEICGGDVIKMPPELCCEQDETTGVVEFSYGRFYVKDKQFIDGTKHVVDFYDFNDPEVQFEVIGNIHESNMEEVKYD